MTNDYGLYMARRQEERDQEKRIYAELKRNFTAVKHAKPPASRKDSSEWYVIASGFKGRADAEDAAENDAELT